MKLLILHNLIPNNTDPAIIAQAFADLGIDSCVVEDAFTHKPRAWINETEVRARRADLAVIEAVQKYCWESELIYNGYRVVDVPDNSYYCTYYDDEYMCEHMFVSLAPITEV